jgi:hypothetical protein
VQKTFFADSELACEGATILNFTLEESLIQHQNGLRGAWVTGIGACVWNLNGAELRDLTIFCLEDLGA